MVNNKEKVRQLVHKTLEDFESAIAYRYRFGSKFTKTSVRNLLADKLIRIIKHNTSSEWQIEDYNNPHEDPKGGIFKLGALLNADEIKDIKSYFQKTPAYNSSLKRDSDGVQRYLGKGAEEERLAGYAMSDVMAAPHLLELANSPKVLSAAQSMLGGCPPVITLLSAWWAFPHTDKPITYLGQDFHRDTDGTKNAALFTYLTDVEENSGPHEYIKYTSEREIFVEYLTEHFPITIPADRKAGRKISDVEYFFQDNYHGEHLNSVYNKYLSALIETITGPQGTSFITDTFGLHRGTATTTTPRLVFLSRFGIKDNFNRNHREAENYEKWSWQQLNGRLEDSFTTRYVNHAIID